MSTTRTSLIERARDLRDPAAWGEFDQLYRPLLMRYARRRGLAEDEADDVAQQCLQVVVERIADFRRRKSFRGWLRRIVDHKVSHQIARNHQARQADTAVLDGAASTELTPPELWERHWMQTHLLYCLAGVRDDFGAHTIRAFEMYVFEERSVAEICEALGMTANQVYVAKSRIMKRLRERYAALMESLYGGEA